MACTTQTTYEDMMKYVEKTLFSMYDENRFAQMMTELANFQELDHKIYFLVRYPSMDTMFRIYLIAPNAPVDFSRQKQVYATVEQMLASDKDVNDHDDFDWYIQNGYNVISMDALKSVYSFLIDVSLKKNDAMLTAYTLLSESTGNINASASFARYCLELCVKVPEGIANNS